MRGWRVDWCQLCDWFHAPDFERQCCWRADKRRLTQGGREPSHQRPYSRKSPKWTRQSNPSGPGSIAKIETQIKPKSHIFEADHQMRVSVIGVYFPRTTPLRNQEDFNVFSTLEAPSDVIFPITIHGSEVGFDDSVSVEGPDTDVPIAPSQKTGL